MKCETSEQDGKPGLASASVTITDMAHQLPTTAARCSDWFAARTRSFWLWTCKTCGKDYKPNFFIDAEKLKIFCPHCDALELESEERGA